LNVIAAILAQVTTAPATAPGGQRPPAMLEFISSPIFALMLGLLVLYFFIFRSKRNQDRKRQDMLGELKRGDRVQTIGGAFGTVVDVREQDVVVKVDESTNTKIRFIRSAIHRVLEDEKSDTK
jgi:preprotein translocase subunit YajC